MERLPAGGTAELATKGDVRLLKDDIRLLEHKIDGVEQRLRAEMHAEMNGLRAEMHRMGRSITVTLLVTMTTVMALFNGMLFAALKLT